MTESGSSMKRSLVSRSAFIFAIRFFPLAGMAAAGIACSHLLPNALNGAYLKVWTYLAVFVAIAACGIPPLLLTHTPDSVDSWLGHLKGKHLRLYSTWLAVLALVLAILFLRHPAFSFWVVTALFLVQVWVLLTETYLIIHRRFIPTLIASVAYALGFCVLHYLFLRAYITFTTLFGLIALVGALRATVLTSIGLSHFRKRGTVSHVAMPVAIQKQWTQLGIYDVSQVFFRWIDKVIISAITGPVLFSIYFNGTQDVPFMNTLLSAVGNGVLQQMAVGEKSSEARLKLVNLTGALLGRIVFPIFFFLFFFRKEFIVFVLSDKYLASVPIFAIAILVLPLRAYNFTSVLQHLNRVKTINWGAVLDLSVALTLTYPLYLWKGLPGVAFAFMISTYIQVAFYLTKTAGLLHCSILQLIPWKQWLVMLLIFGCIGIGLHEGLSRHFSPKHALFLGFAGTVVVIATALLPVIFTKKAHG